MIPKNTSVPIHLGGSNQHLHPPAMPHRATVTIGTGEEQQQQQQHYSGANPANGTLVGNGIGGGSNIINSNRTLHTSSSQHLQHQLHQLQPIRSVYINQQEFDQMFQFGRPPRFSWHRLSKRLCLRYFQCLRSIEEFLFFLLSFVPILQWLPVYSIRDNLAGDFMAGITVGVVQVPQGIAYAILAGLDPVHGLYTSFFAVLFYMVFGTSKHISIGPFAILSLMTGISCRDIYAQLDKEFFEAELSSLRAGTVAGGANDLSALGNVSQLGIPLLEVEYSELVQTITLTAGLIQIAMAVLRVEFLASYLSDQLVNGFCTGAAVHVIGVQLGKLLQLNLGHIGGPGYLANIVRNLFIKLPECNPLALGMSIIGFVFLYLCKDVFNTRLRTLVSIALPFELILVVLGTGISAAGAFNQNFNITVLNRVPSGFPFARLPRIDLLPYVFGDALEIAFVSVALHLSMCKVFNRRMNTKTDNNLELYALGIVGSLSSFFTTYPVTSVLGRSMLNVECGAKTQLSALFSALLLLIVIFFLGPLLSALPVCILAVIIIFSMKSVFQKMPREFVHLWRVSKIDFLIWVVTIIATVVLNVMQGLALSVTFALLTTVFRIQWPRWHLLSNLTGTENYRDSGRYGRVTPLGHGIRIFRFDAPLLFTNVDHFANSAFSAITMPAPSSNTYSANTNGMFDSNKCIDMSTRECNGNGTAATTQQPLLLLANGMEEKNKKKSVGTVGSENSAKSGWQQRRRSLSIECRVQESGVRSLIVDCTGFTFVDYTSINALADLYHQLSELNVNVLFAGAKAPVRDMLQACQFFNSVPKEQFYPTIHDAVLAASNKKKWQRRKRGFSELSLKKASAVGQEDTNSLCVGENELYQWSFKQTDAQIGDIIQEEEEEEEQLGEELGDEFGILERGDGLGGADGEVENDDDAQGKGQTKFF